eukprot:1733146-Rhodomonas_salina.1
MTQACGWSRDRTTAMSMQTRGRGKTGGSGAVVYGSCETWLAVLILSRGAEATAFSVYRGWWTRRRVRGSGRAAWGERRWNGSGRQGGRAG